MTKPRTRSRANAKKAGSAFERFIADHLRDTWDDRIDRQVKPGARDVGQPQGHLFQCARTGAEGDQG